MLRRHLWRSEESGWAFAVVVTLLFAVLLALGQAHHEFWRDETHPWVVAREAQGFWDIATGDRMYDGHPPLWYWYLRVWTWFTRSIVGLHIATVVAEAAAGFCLLKWGPFPRALKVLLLCSYIFGYEYGIMARNYTMGVLMAFAFAATYHPLRNRWSSYLCLGLLALSSVFGLIMAASLALLLIVRRSRLDWGRDDGSSVWSFRAPIQIYLGAVFLFLVFVFTYLVTNPPDPNPYSPAWVTSNLNATAIKPSLDRLVAAFVPLRKPTDPGYWLGASQYLAEYPKVFEGLNVAVPALMILVLLPAWREAVVLVIGCLLMTFILVARYAGHIRHWGNYLVLFLVVSWIARRERPRSRHVLNTLFLLAVGVCQAQGFWVAYKFDWKRPFSGAEDAAKAIEKQGLQNLPLVIGPDWVAMAVTGYLDRTFVSAETEEVNQTMVFHGRRRAYSPEALVERAVTLAKEKHTDVLVISNRPLAKPANAPRFELVYQPRESVVMGDEDFWAYRLGGL